MKLLYTIFGGTFDPFHYGHLLSCKFLSNEIQINKIIIIPNNIPPHRNIPTTSIINRLNMIKLSIQNNPLFQISTIEFEKNEISYTIQTIKKIKKMLNKNISLGLIIGEDNLQTFDHWHDWIDFLKICHIIVCSRNNKKIILKNYILNQWIQNYQIKNYKLLKKYSSGCIFFSKNPLINISSTKIRKKCKKQENISKLVNKKVEQYIINNNLYNK